jgi:hypothetical protein
VKRRHWAIVAVSAVLGGGLAFTAGSCGGEDRGEVEVQQSTTGTTGTSTTGTSTSGTSTSGSETSTTP